MEIAAKILIVGGVLNLAYSFLTGLLLANTRRRSPAASKYLVFAHVGPLMQGPMLLTALHCSRQIVSASLRGETVNCTGRSTDTITFWKRRMVMMPEASEISTANGGNASRSLPRARTFPVFLEPASAAHALSISTLVELCQQEIYASRRGEPSTDEYGLELSRRAIIHGDVDSSPH